jgi:hypothetical protein
VSHLLGYRVKLAPSPLGVVDPAPYFAGFSWRMGFLQAFWGRREEVPPISWKDALVAKHVLGSLVRVVRVVRRERPRCRGAA